MNKRKSRENRYEKIQKNARIIHKYEPAESSITKEQFLDLLSNKDSIKIILNEIKNRKDADDIFISALLKSPRFWRYLLVTFLILSIVISYGVCHYSVPLNHVIEKTVNSKIPDLLPLPSQ